ncbi:hypothetical protein PI124_g22160 [Phytophthora idaei]|nr:hypothetical protein PI125_g24262 [Phytophthora idaei]KAG3232763.1 hypothetical protein PI124_g22160 [Phytophthora idaei]
MARRGRRSGVNQLLKRDDAVAGLRDLRPKNSLDVRRGLRGLRDLRLLIAQNLLQLGDVRALDLFQGDYTIIQSVGVTVNLGLTVPRGIFPPPPSPRRDARGSTRWIVERIVGYEPPKTNRDQACIRIRWRGFPPHRASWEPQNDLMEDVPEMMRAYEAQNGVQA